MGLTRTRVTTEDTMTHTKGMIPVKLALLALCAAIFASCGPSLSQADLERAVAKVMADDGEKPTPEAPAAAAETEIPTPAVPNWSDWSGDFWVAHDLKTVILFIRNGSGTQFAKPQRLKTEYSRKGGRTLKMPEDLSRTLTEILLSKTDGKISIVAHGSEHGCDFTYEVNHGDYAKVDGAKGQLMRINFGGRTAREMSCLETWFPVFDLTTGPDTELQDKK
ncbi:hypothetical protein C0581_04420 [Candidatus Parcubacteria bacterium]|nr:MAG: hypothetical protein C0581_04420 [Candidatus Parcubacteria bacterium]